MSWIFRRILKLFLGFGLFFSLSGCIEKTVLPALILSVTSVTPYELKPTSATDATTGATTYTLPTTVIALRSMTKVPARLVSFNISYSTRIGQPLPSLRIDETPYDLYLTPDSTINITMSPYSERVLNLFLFSTSEISPIRAVMTLTVKDVNNNTIHRDAHCLLLKP